MGKSRRFFILFLSMALMLSGCMAETVPIRQGRDSISEDGELPELPDRLETGENGLPVLKVYNIKTESVESVDIEEYLLGVVAGEMKNDWPMEALKAQAILARTFVLKFCADKTSKYPGADISTDVSEAQAYAPENINDRIRQAVADTAGEVISDDGEFIHAWFFAHSGGMTELPSVALDYPEEDPDYLDERNSPDSDMAPDDVKNWTVTFSKEQVLSALKDAGLQIDTIEKIEIGERGESGRAATILVNGNAVSAPTFRIAIGANKMKSTLLEELNWDGNTLTLSGKGFGHGVGLSQWGAYALAEQGKSAEEIIGYYFEDIDIVRLW